MDIQQPTPAYRSYTDAAGFLSRAQPDLERDEVTINLILGLSFRLISQPDYYRTRPYFATVSGTAADGSERLQLAAVCTPPHNLILYAAPVDCGTGLRVLADHLLEELPGLPGVLAPAQLAGDFSRAWSRASGNAARLVTHERVYELRRVNPIRPARGRMRRAEEADLPLLAAWTGAFDLEAVGTADTEEQKAYQARVRLPHTYLWEDGRPVSMACISRYTPHGAVIGPVYTPPEQRGRGYASGVVAGLSQHLLDSGRRFCALFTNLANPTPNHIYQEIGYEPRGDFHEFRFGQRPEKS